MQTYQTIKWDESSFDETAKILAKINSEVLGKSVVAIIERMKSQTVSIMLEKADREFTHWGTAGFYVTVFPATAYSEDFYATATLMPYTVARALGMKS